MKKNVKKKVKHVEYYKKCNKYEMTNELPIN